MAQAVKREPADVATGFAGFLAGNPRINSGSVHQPAKRTGKPGLAKAPFRQQPRLGSSQPQWPQRPLPAAALAQLFGDLRVWAVAEHGRRQNRSKGHNAAQPQPKTRRVIRRRACFVAPRCHHKAKVKLGPTRSFGRDALRRVLARNEYIVIQGTIGRAGPQSAINASTV